MKSECIIYYESWEMQCCGEVFSVWEQVKWKIAPNDDNHQPLKGVSVAIDYYYDAHDASPDKSFWFSGKVVDIQAVFTKYIKSVSKNVMIAEKNFLTPITTADGIHSTDQDDFVWAGYIVHLKNCKKIKI